jgi:hypothetical protein
VKLTNHLHLVPRLRMRGAIPSLPNTPSWRRAQLKHSDMFTFTFYKCVLTILSVQRDNLVACLSWE